MTVMSAAPVACVVVLLAGCPKTQELVQPEAPVVVEIEGSAAQGSRKSEKCTECHGENGNPTDSDRAKLAGQRPAYIAKQLRDFRDGARSHEDMTEKAADLDDQTIADLAAWYSTQMRTRERGEPRLAKPGKALYLHGRPDAGLPSCTQCHGPQGQGRDGVIPGGFPVIAAQNRAYFIRQVTSFRDGERANDENGMMRAVASRLSDDDIRALAEFSAGLSPAALVEAPAPDHDEDEPPQ